MLFLSHQKEQLYSNQDCLKEYFSKVFKNTYTYNKCDMLDKEPYLKISLFKELV